MSEKHKQKGFFPLYAFMLGYINHEQFPLPTEKMAHADGLSTSETSSVPPGTHY